MGLLNLIVQSTKQFDRRALRFRVNLLTNLGFNNKYDQTSFTNPDFLQKLTNKQLELPSELRRVPIEFDVRLWNGRKRLKGDLFKERCFLHAKLYVISRDQSSDVLLTSANFTAAGIGLGSGAKNFEIGVWERDRMLTSEISGDLQKILDQETDSLQQSSEELTEFYSKLPTRNPFHSLEGYLTLKRVGYEVDDIPASRTHDLAVQLFRKRGCPTFASMSADIIISRDEEIIERKETIPLLKHNDEYTLPLTSHIQRSLRNAGPDWQRITLQFIFSVETKWNADRQPADIDYLRQFIDNQEFHVVNVDSGKEEAVTNDTIANLTQGDLDRIILRHYGNTNYSLRCKTTKVVVNKEIPPTTVLTPRLGCAISSNKMIIPVMVGFPQGSEYLELTEDDFAFFLDQPKLTTRIKNNQRGTPHIKQHHKEYAFMLEVEAPDQSLGNELSLHLTVKSKSRYDFRVRATARIEITDRKTVQLTLMEDVQYEIRVIQEEFSLQLHPLGQNIWSGTATSVLNGLYEIVVQGIEDSPLYFVTDSITSDVCKIACFSICEIFARSSAFSSRSDRLAYLVNNSMNSEDWKQFETEERSFDGLTECPFMASNCKLVHPEADVNVFVSIADIKGIREMSLRSGTALESLRKLGANNLKSTYQTAVKVADASFQEQFIPFDYRMQLVLRLANSIKTSLDWDNNFRIKPFDGFHGVSRKRGDFLRDWMNKGLVVQTPQGATRELIGPRDVWYSEEDGLWGISYYKNLNPGTVRLKA